MGTVHFTGFCRNAGHHVCVGACRLQWAWVEKPVPGTHTNTGESACGLGESPWSGRLKPSFFIIAESKRSLESACPSSLLKESQFSKVFGDDPSYFSSSLLSLLLSFPFLLPPLPPTCLFFSFLFLPLFLQILGALTPGRQCAGC